MCNNAISGSPKPIAAPMKPRCESVEYASDFLISVCPSAQSPPSAAMPAQSQSIVVSTSGVSRKKIRTMKNTPAATIVAA